MKSRFSAGIAIVFLLFGVAGVSQAALVNIGTATYHDVGTYNLIYDADGPLGPITWLDYSHTSAQWTDQVIWAATLGQHLTVELNSGYTTDLSWLAGWRLPSAGADPLSGFNQLTSEMGHLFYEEDKSEFTELKASWYWSGTEYANAPGNAGNAGYFDMHYGIQGDCPKNGYYYGLAVRSGQVSAVPVPGGIWLLGSGLAGLTVLKRKKKNRV